jgi:hypothetical protein
MRLTRRPADSFRINDIEIAIAAACPQGAASPRLVFVLKLDTKAFTNFY